MFGKGQNEVQALNGGKPLAWFGHDAPLVLSALVTSGEQDIAMVFLALSFAVYPDETILSSLSYCACFMSGTMILLR